MKVRVYRSKSGEIFLSSGNFVPAVRQFSDYWTFIGWTTVTLRDENLDELPIAEQEARGRGESRA